MASANVRVDWLQKLLNLVKRNILDFNLLENPNRRSEDELKLQRISTRIFILLLSLTLFVFISYVALQNITHIVTIKNPSIAQFNSMYQQYRN